MCCRCCSVKQQKIWLYTMGSLLTVVGLVLVTAWPAIFTKITNSFLVLSPSSYSFSKWEITPVPLYMTFYLYNWTNSEEVGNPEVKPNFQELGPYSFREIKEKEELHWNDENSTVTFFGRRTWYFDSKRSNGSLDDRVIVPNFATVSGAKITNDMNKIFRKILNFALNREGGTLTMNATAIEWLFDGFYDYLFDFVNLLHSPLFPIPANFAWFYGRNNSKDAEGTFTIHTGKTDLSQMGDLRLWNGSSHTGYWEGECGKVNGSMGDLWAPRKSWDETISIFIPDAARFINLYPQSERLYRGVNARLYTSTNHTFDSGHIVEDTKCFCVPGRECPRNGVIDYSPVTFRGPVYLSHPHFYMTDPLYRANTTGLNPDPEKHSIYALMEPTLGVPLDMKGQVLLSLLVEPNEDIDLLRDVAHTFYAPLFVIQLEAQISDEILSFLKFALIAPSVGQYIGIGLLVIGVILIAAGVWLSKSKSNKSQGDNPIEKSKINHLKQ